MKFLILFLIITSPLFSQAADTAVIEIRGTVPPIVSIGVTATAVASNLNFQNSGSEVVATVVEFSNVRAGYSLSITSTNSGTFIGLDGGETFGYSILYNAQPVLLQAGTGILTNSQTKTPRSGLTNSLSVDWDVSAINVSDDTYTDTLTLTIVAN